ncbi:MAG: hypothetical protein M0004_04430 [Actinomycetota bacterium]|nr:hypothetical protein [Actinomycetota bacterium]
MPRRTFDLIVSSAGLLIAAILIIAGSLLTWGYNYVGDQVHNQLAAQQIFFPSAAAFKNAKPGTEITPAMRPYLERYAGQQLLSGPQAEAYADHFIALHLQRIGGGKSYAQLSGESLANPNDRALAATVQTMFQGTTLRGLLLEAYAFATIGSLAGWGAVLAFCGAFLLVVLTGLGVLHARRVAPEDELFAARATKRSEVA